MLTIITPSVTEIIVAKLPLNFRLLSEAVNCHMKQFLPFPPVSFAVSGIDNQCLHAVVKCFCMLIHFTVRCSSETKQHIAHSTAETSKKGQHINKILCQKNFIILTVSFESTTHYICNIHLHACMSNCCCIIA